VEEKYWGLGENSAGTILWSRRGESAERGATFTVKVNMPDSKLCEAG